LWGIIPILIFTVVEVGQSAEGLIACLQVILSASRTNSSLHKDFLFSFSPVIPKSQEDRSAEIPSDQQHKSKTIVFND